MPDLLRMDPNNLEALWRSCFSTIENIVDKITFETVIKYVHPSARDNNTLELALPKAWQRDQLGKFLDTIRPVVSDTLGGPVNLTITVGGNGSVYPEESAISGAERSFRSPGIDPGPRPVLPACSRGNGNDREISHDSGEIRCDTEKLLNPRYTFDTFVVGSGNRFAHAAALAVGDGPATTYNPLFIYGGVGLGKTHLINAIGHRVISNNPDARVAYVSAEKFMNDMIESIQNKKMMDFRRKYRNVNALLIDDIQFIKNKESTQEEFFHTFNELHSAKAQIVITSDRPPKDIPTLEDRLRSRFEWGLIADISPPDVETRIAILKKKAQVEQVDVPGEIILYIAEKIPSNIRELEGALNRVICYGSLMNLPLSMDLALQALKSIIPDSRSQNMTISFIQEKICEYFNIRMEDLLGNCRESRLVIPRQVAMYLCKDLLGFSYPNIGKAFGGRDHTTVMHACRKIEKSRREASMKNDLQNIRDLLKNHGG